MGLKAKITKQSNRMYLDFNDAYWSIDNLRIGSAEEQIIFEFNAYPSRECKYAFGTPLVTDFKFGTPEDMAVNSKLYTWTVGYPIADIFPQYIPITEAAQKEIIYPFLKAQLLKMGYVFEDVLEE